MSHPKVPSNYLEKVPNPPASDCVYQCAPKDQTCRNKCKQDMCEFRCKAFDRVCTPEGFQKYPQQCQDNQKYQSICLQNCK